MAMPSLRVEATMGPISPDEKVHNMDLVKPPLTQCVQILQVLEKNRYFGREDLENVVANILLLLVVIDATTLSYLCWR